MVRVPYKSKREGRGKKRLAVSTDFLIVLWDLMEVFTERFAVGRGKKIWSDNFGWPCPEVYYHLLFQHSNYISVIASRAMSLLLPFPTLILCRVMSSTAPDKSCLSRRWIFCTSTITVTSSLWISPQERLRSHFWPRWTSNPFNLED